MNNKADSLSVAVCQLTSNDSVDANVDGIIELLKSIKSPSEIDLIAFPENCIYLRLDKNEPPPRLELRDPRLQRLVKTASELKTNLHLGSVPLVEDGRLYNASVLLTSEGETRVLYKKIHLFDVDVEGAAPQRESETFAPGQAGSTFSIKGWKFGSSICYDLRFSELFSRYAKEEVDVILIPAAFLVETGRDHWEILIRARAIESQVYALAAAQGGVHVGMSGTKRSTYGHSLIIGPWGEKIAEGNDSGVQILQATLTKQKIESVRKQIPMKSHRKLS